MKSLQNNQYLYRKSATGFVTWELRNHNVVIFKGRNYAIDGFVEIDVNSLFIKDYYAINVCELLHKIHLGGTQCMVTELLDLDLVWFPNVPNQEEIIHIDVDMPVESEYTTLLSNTPHQVIIFAKNIFYNNFMLDIQGSQKEQVLANGLYPSRVIVIADRYDIGDAGELIISNRTTGKEIDRFLAYTISEGCDKANMYLITDTIDAYNVTSSEVTYTNSKSTLKSSTGYDVVYDVNEGMTIPVVLEEQYTKELYEKINNNLGVIVTIDDDVNYGIIDADSIHPEKHKQAFTIKI